MFSLIRIYHHSWLFLDRLALIWALLAWYQRNQIQDIYFDRTGSRIYTCFLCPPLFQSCSRCRCGSVIHQAQRCWQKVIYRQNDTRIKKPLPWERAASHTDDWFFSSLHHDGSGRAVSGAHFTTSINHHHPLHTLDFSIRKSWLHSKLLLLLASLFSLIVSRLDTEKAPVDFDPSIHQCLPWCWETVFCCMLPFVVFQWNNYSLSSSSLFFLLPVKVI